MRYGYSVRPGVSRGFMRAVGIAFLVEAAAVFVIWFIWSR